MTAPDQVLAKGSWEADEKALKLTLDVFESFPLAPCAAPGTVITIESPVFDWDKSVLTERVEDFLLLRDYTHRADGKDREQLCKQRRRHLQAPLARQTRGYPGLEGPARSN